MIRFVAIIFSIILPLQVSAAVLTDPNTGVHPTSVFYDNSTTLNNGVIKEGVISEVKAPEVEKRKLVEPLLLDVAGVGTTCTVNTPVIEAWQLDPNVSITTKDQLRQVLEGAVSHDERLRQVSIVDNRIDLYYLMPAYRLRIIPVNYQLHIVADSNTFRMSLENPKWVAGVPNKHAIVSAAFAEYVPQLLSQETVTAYKDAPLAMRDAKLIEVITSVMYHVDVMPHGGTFFSCYILPFLVYIIGALIILIFLLWFIIRRTRRLRARQKILGLSMNEENDEENDDSEGGYPPRVHYVPGRPDQ